VQQLDVDADDLAVEAFELPDLVLHMGAEVLRHLDVPSSEHDLHETSRLRGL